MLWVLEETNTIWNKIKCPKIDPCGYNKPMCYKGDILNLQMDRIFKK